MLETLAALAERVGTRRANEQARRLASEAGADLPVGIRIEAERNEIRISGRGLKRRLLIEPVLRWMTEKLR